MLKELIMRNASLILLGTCVLLLPGCGGSDREKAREDRSDPKNVAAAFLRAVADHDVDRAASYVLPSLQEEFRRGVESDGWPEIPATPDLSVSTKVLDGLKRADVDVLNADGLGLDMVFSDGLWWIDK